MERLRSRWVARRAQVTRYVNKARELLDHESTNPTHLAAVRDCLIESKLELQQIDEEFEAVVPIEELEVEYAAAAECTGRAIHELSRINQAIELLVSSCVRHI